MQKSVIVLIATILAATGAVFAADKVDDRAGHAAPAPAMVLAQADPAGSQAGGNSSSPSGPSSTTEIPTNAGTADPAGDPNDPGGQNPPDPAAQNAPNQNDGLAEYENQQVPMPNVSSLQEFINQGVSETPIGVQVEEDCTKLSDHERVCGLAVLDVKRNSPAALAGIKPYSALGRHLLDGASVAAAVFFPPAIMAVGIISQTHVGESFDLIIGVDGRRTRHLLDLEDLTANDKPGEVVYLTIVRSGKRMQIPVRLPATYSAFSY